MNSWAVSWSGSSFFPCITFFLLGFDVQGAAQLGHKLLKTKKWIGATEIAVFLRFIGIKYEWNLNNLKDFNLDKVVQCAVLTFARYIYIWKFKLTLTRMAVLGQNSKLLWAIYIYPFIEFQDCRFRIWKRLPFIMALQTPVTN